MRCVAVLPLSVGAAQYNGGSELAVGAVADTHRASQTDRGQVLALARPSSSSRQLEHKPVIARIGVSRSRLSPANMTSAGNIFRWRFYLSARAVAPEAPPLTVSSFFLVSGTLAVSPPAEFWTRPTWETLEDGADEYRCVDGAAGRAPGWLPDLAAAAGRCSSRSTAGHAARYTPDINYRFYGALFRLGPVVFGWSSLCACRQRSVGAVT